MMTPTNYSHSAMRKDCQQSQSSQSVTSKSSQSNSQTYLSNEDPARLEQDKRLIYKYVLYHIQDLKSFINIFCATPYSENSHRRGATGYYRKSLHNCNTVSIRLWVYLDWMYHCRHPLYPLLALLFEKCELATQSPDSANTDSFTVDVQTFVQVTDYL